MDKDDLKVLLDDAPAGEIDQLHRLLNQWAVGPDSSYPVQLALLTRAQWRAAASIPRSVANARKELEVYFTDHRKQAATLIGNLARTGRDQFVALREIIEAHRLFLTRIEQLADQRDTHLAAVAAGIKADLEPAEVSWQQAKVDFESERQQLAQARKDLEARQDWRDWLVFARLVIAVLLAGIAVGLLIRS